MRNDGIVGDFILREGGGLLKGSRGAVKHMVMIPLPAFALGRL